MVSRIDRERLPGASRRPVALLLLLVGLTLVPAARAAAVTATAEVDRHRVSTGQSVTLRVTVTGEYRGTPAIPAPVIEGVEVVSGGTSQSFSFDGQQASSTVTVTYHLLVGRDDSFAVPALAITLDGRTYHTREIPIEVVRGAVAPPGRTGAAPEPPDRPQVDAGEGAGRPGDEIFITLEADRRRAYVGQQIILTFRYHRRVQLWDGPRYTPPRTEGFWREDLPPERNYVETIAGQRYRVTEIRYALFPTHAGDLRVEPAEVQVPTDLFESFLRRQGRHRGPRLLRTPPVPIRVLPLPAAPPDHAGVVASDLSLSAVLDRTEVPRGEAVGLRLQVTADGLLKSMRGPALAVPDSVRVHDARDDLILDRDAGRLRSVYRAEKVLVPLREGELRLPPVTLTYFDPEAGRYRTASAELPPVSVLPGELPAPPALAGGGATPIERLRDELAFIHPVPRRLGRGGRPLLARPGAWALAGLPLLLVGAARWRRDRLDARARDPLTHRRLEALSRARRRLKGLRRLDDGPGALGAIAGAIAGYVADRTGRAEAAVSRAAVADFAREAGREEAGRRLGEILELCDAARFAGPAGGGGAAAGAAALAGEAADLLAELDRSAAGPRSRRRPGLPLVLLLLALGAAGVVAAAAAPTGGAAAADPARLMAEGNDAYVRGDLEVARRRYEAALAGGADDPALHFNLGNVHARQGDLGRAVASYLRARRQDPRDEDLRRNLSWVRSRIRDRKLQGEGLPPVVAQVAAAVGWLTLDEWTAILIVAIWAAGVLLVLGWRRGSGSATLRRARGAALAALAIAVLVVGFRARAELLRRTAVVVAPEVEVRSGPADSFPVIFRLHDGLTLSLRERQGGWARIDLGGDWVGWVPAAAVETVRPGRSASVASAPPAPGGAA